MPISSNKSIRRSANEPTRASQQPVPMMPTAATQRPRWPGWQTIWEALRGPYPTLISRAVLGVVFLLAGIGKALDMRAFAVEIDAYQMVPGTLVQPMSIALPLLEILIGVYVLLGLMQRWAAGAAGALLLIFIAAMAWAMLRGLTLDCGCFGNVPGLSAFRDTVSAGTILRDALWLLLAVHLMLVPGIWSVDTLRRKPTTP
jgi:uncharacterized membrane protein YphA (DoxX/SURF4 family)